MVNLFSVLRGSPFEASRRPRCLRHPGGFTSLLGR